MENKSYHGEPYCPSTIADVFRRFDAEKIHHDTYTDMTRMKMEEYNVELNFNKEVYVESSNLIHQYIQLDPRVKPSLYALKLYGRGRNIFACK